MATVPSSHCPPTDQCAFSGKAEADPAVIFIVNERRLHEAMLFLAGSSTDGGARGTIQLTPPLRRGKQNILLLGIEYRVKHVVTH